MIDLRLNFIKSNVDFTEKNAYVANLHAHFFICCAQFSKFIAEILDS